MLCSIADVYDAMRSQRKYQQAFPTDRIKAVLERNDGQQFDQNLVRRFVQLIGIYPPGNLVRLNTQEIGVVLKVYAPDPHRPRVRVVMGRTGEMLAKPYDVNLWESDESGEWPDSVDRAARSSRASDRPAGVDVARWCDWRYSSWRWSPCRCWQRRSRARSTPSPEAFFGYGMGAGPRLPTWDLTVEYLRAVARTSRRVRVDEIGKTTGGRPYLLVTISTPDTLRSLAGARAAQHRLADPRVTTDAQAERIAREHKAVVLIGAGVHSNETGSAQAVNELVWRLATERSPAIDHLLRNLMVLVVPSQNPDGLQMVAEWQARNAGTPYEDAPLPELYHPYAGHDNNRDGFMQTQVETQHLSRLLYRDWLPEVYLDLHQMGPTRARVFVPPYRNPANPNIDPLVWSQANLLGQTMATRLQAEGKTGVLWGETYSGYWQGANSTTPWWHNIIGMLSEVASARPTSAVVQESARAAPGSLAVPPERPQESAQLAPPSDVQFRMNYPEPWLGGRWTPRDVVEHHLLAALGLLEGVANNRSMLKRNFHAMQRRTIERFTQGGPWAFAVPATQRDRGAADHLLHLLAAGGAEVEIVTGSGAPGLAPGDAVIRLAQPFGRWVKDLLEPQVYPEPRTAVDRPYDVTAWTLGLQMGVTVASSTRPCQSR